MNTKKLFLSKTLKLIFLSVFGIFSPFAHINAQDYQKPVVSPNVKGSTLIIASNLSSDYDSSRLLNSRTSTIWRVGVDTDGDVNLSGGTGFYYWNYLDAAINQALSLNYQNIIILEGLCGERSHNC